MDDVRDIGEQISLLEAELSARMSTSQGPRNLLMAHSTPKTLQSDLSDSGIHRTHIDGLNSRTKRVSIGLENSTALSSAPTPDGPYPISRGQSKVSGARPKTHMGDHARAMTELGDTDNMPSPRAKAYYAQGIEMPTKASTPTKTRREVKLANYDGSGEWQDFKSHFDVCAVLNNWDDDDKGLYLATALRGPAQAVFSDLPPEKRMDHETLINALEERFSPPNQTELYRVQLKEKRQRASESLPELGQAIRRLVSKAYPNAPNEVRETLAREHFLDALVDSEMRIRIKQSRPENLNQTICLAVELEAFCKAENTYETGRGHMRATTTVESRAEVTDLRQQMATMMDSFSAKINALQKDLNRFKNNMSRRSQDIHNSDWKKNIKCYNCEKLGHFARECEEPKKKSDSGNKEGAARPVYSNRRQRRFGQRRESMGACSSNTETGVYLDMKFNNVPTKFLVDTGATVTLVSHKLYYQTPFKDRAHLQKVSQVIMSANGTELKIAGKGTFQLRLGKSTFKVDALVADLSVDGILGLDFMKDNNCTIDLQKDSLMCNNNRYHLKFCGRVGCNRVSAAKDICIPSRTQTNSHEKINDLNTALLAKTLGQGGESATDRLLNVSDNVKTVNVGTIVAEISGTDEVISTENKVDKVVMMVGYETTYRLKCTKCRYSFAKRKHLKRHDKRKHEVHNKTVVCDALSSHANIRNKQNLTKSSKRRFSFTETKLKRDKCGRRRYYCSVQDEKQQSCCIEDDAFRGNLAHGKAPWRWACGEVWPSG